MSPLAQRLVVAAGGVLLVLAAVIVADAADAPAAEEAVFATPAPVADALAQHAAGAVLHPQLRAALAGALGVTPAAAEDRLREGDEPALAALLDALGGVDDLLSTAALAYGCGLPSDQALSLADRAATGDGRGPGLAPLLAECGGADTSRLATSLTGQPRARVGAAFALARRGDRSASPALCAAAADLARSGPQHPDEVLLRWAAAHTGAPCP